MKRKIAIIAFPGITMEEAQLIAGGLKREATKTGITIFVTNVAVETMSRKEFLSALKT